MRSVIKASKTLKAIDDAIAADQGGAYRQHLQRVLPHIGDAYRGTEDGFRSHLGASVLGQECGRAIWYGFRWFTKPKFSGRILRLFNRGHLEEGRVIAALLTIGVQIFQQDEHGKQFRISDIGGHFGGSGDGVAIGLPDLPSGTAALLEFKTHNDKSFAKLEKEGVRGAKFEHWVQMQTYMSKMGIPVALYVAVNKNDDNLWMELVYLDSASAEQFRDRARTIILLRQPPARISESPGWFACKWCDHAPVCHKKAAPEKNCRSCMHSEAREDGTWRCMNPGAEELVLSKEMQAVGCGAYEAHK
jgi:hypothetical protein